MMFAAVPAQMRIIGDFGQKGTWLSFYFILQLLYDVMDIPFGMAGLWDGE
jgi:hypothetical protein